MKIPISEMVMFCFTSMLWLGIYINDTLMSIFGGIMLLLHILVISVTNDRIYK